MYGWCGFDDIETVRFDLEEYGMEGVEGMTEMIWRPAMNANLGMLCQRNGKPLRVPLAGP